MNRSVLSPREHPLAPVAAAVLVICALANLAVGFDCISDPLSRAPFLYAAVKRAVAVVNRAVEGVIEVGEEEADHPGPSCH